MEYKEVFKTENERISFLYLVLFNAEEGEFDDIAQKVRAELKEMGWPQEVIFDNDGMPMVVYQEQEPSFCPYNWMMDAEQAGTLVPAMNEFTGWNMELNVFDGFDDWQHLKR